MLDPSSPTSEHGHLAALARGSAATLAGALVSTVASFGLVILVTRSVEQEDAGTFFAATAVFVVALAAAGLGTDTGLARFVLQYDADRPRAVRALLRAAVVPVVVCSCGLGLVLFLSGPATRPLAWALPIAALADLCLAAARAHARFGSTVVIDRIVRPGLQIVLVGLALVLGAGNACMAAAWAGAYAVAAVLAAYSLAGLLGPGSWRRTESLGRRFWSFTWPRSVARISQVTIQKADIVLVAWLLSPRDAAVYTVATRFVVFGQLASQAVSSVVQPRFTAILATEGDDSVLRRVFHVSASWSVLLAWPVYLCAAAAPAAYLGWFGESYTSGEAARVVLIMSGGMLVAVASGPVDTLLLMAGRSGLSLANTLIALALDLGLCLLLLPLMGITGAAVAWVTALAVRCALAVVQLRADLRLVPDVRGLALAGSLPVLCLAVPVGLVGLLVGLTPVTWLIACLVAAVGYAAAVWRLRAPLGVDAFLDGLRSRSKELVMT